jgi:hypothetical protein
MDDGLSNAEIHRQLNAQLKNMNLKIVPRATVDTLVNDLLDEEVRTALNTAVRTAPPNSPTAQVPPPAPKKAPAPPRINTDLIPKNLFDEEFDSDEEDEEYVPESDEESEDEEDEEYVPESDEESDEEDEEYVPESDEDSADDSSDSSAEDKPVMAAMIFMDHAHGDYFDQIVISSVGDKVRVIHYYDRASSDDFECKKTCFYASNEEAQDYFKTFLKFVAIDQMPFKSLEFHIPFYPAITLKPSRLHKRKYRDLIVKALTEFVNETTA